MLRSRTRSGSKGVGPSRNQWTRMGYNVRLRADDYFARIKLEYFSTSDP